MGRDFGPIRGEEPAGIGARSGALSAEGAAVGRGSALVAGAIDAAGATVLGNALTTAGSGAGGATLGAIVASTTLDVARDRSATPRIAASTAVAAITQTCHGRRAEG